MTTTKSSELGRSGGIVKKDDFFRAALVLIGGVGFLFVVGVGVGFGFGVGVGIWVGVGVGSFDCSVSKFNWSFFNKDFYYYYYWYLPGWLSLSGGLDGPGCCEVWTGTCLVPALDGRLLRAVLEIFAYCPAFVNFVRIFLQKSFVTKAFGIRLLPTNLYRVISSNVANSCGTMALWGLNRDVL